MGRSVSYATGATAVAYGTFEFDDEECWDCEGEGTLDGDEYCQTCDGSGEVPYEPEAHDWLDHIDWFRERIKELYPSTWEQDGWLDREDHVLMGNHHALFGMSEYCGLVSYWMVPRHEAGCKWTTHDRPELSEAWCKRTAKGFVKAFGTLVKLGHMSNGEGVYERIAS